MSHFFFKHKDFYVRSMKFVLVRKTDLFMIFHHFGKIYFSSNKAIGLSNWYIRVLNFLRTRSFLGVWGLCTPSLQFGL